MTVGDADVQRVRGVDGAVLHHVVGQHKKLRCCQKVKIYLHVHVVYDCQKRKLETRVPSSHRRKKCLKRVGVVARAVATTDDDFAFFKSFRSQRHLRDGDKRRFCTNLVLSLKFSL